MSQMHKVLFEAHFILSPPWFIGASQIDRRDLYVCGISLQTMLQLAKSIAFMQHYVSWHFRRGDMNTLIVKRKRNARKMYNMPRYIFEIISIIRNLLFITRCYEMFGIRRTQSHPIKHAQLFETRFFQHQNQIPIDVNQNGTSNDSNQSFPSKSFQNYTPKSQSNANVVPETIASTSARRKLFRTTNRAPIENRLH